MTFFTEERAQLALNRTRKNFEDADRYVLKNPAKTSVLVGSLAVAAVFFPAPVVLALCISALALLCYNLIQPDSLGGGASRGLSHIRSEMGI